MSGLVLGSLFSGVGGFDVAAERVGMAVAWQSEIEPYACRVLAHRFPGVANLGDVTGIGDAPRVDVVTFGSPCQDLSVAGKRAGLEGARSGLFFEACRLIRRCRPAFAVWENVPGALSSNGGRDFGAALDALAGAGALDIAWRVLDTQWFGIPQRRRRLFVVADFAGERAAQVLFEPQGGGGHPAAGRAAGQGVTSGTHGGTDSPGIHLINGNSTPEVSYELAMPLRADDGSGNRQVVARALTSPHNGAGGTYRLDDHENLIAQCHGNNVGPLGALRAGNGGLTGGVPFVASALSASAGHHGHSSPRGDGSDNLVAIRMHNGSANPVIRSEGVVDSLAVGSGHGGGAATHGVAGSFGVRRLTPVECERLQGFPDGWTCLHDHPQPCDCPDAPRYRALGNAVAVPVVAWLLGRMAALAVPA